MKRLLALLLPCVPLDVSLACQRASNAVELHEAQQSKERMKALAADYAKNADRIFIGTVVDLTENSATFRDIVNLKGRTTENMRLEWAIPPLTDVVAGCGGEFDFMNFSAPRDPDATYLIYAKGTQLLRANGGARGKPTIYDEIEWLVAAHRIKIP